MTGDQAAGTFGSKLREARERRGVSLRQIANATKISVGVLEALERNDISRLPGGIFSRAFVRSYAMEVGLDPEATIQEFIGQFPHDSVTAGHATSGRADDHDAIESDRRMATTFLRLILVSIPIAAAVVYFGTAGRRTTGGAEPQPPVAEVTAAPERADLPAAVPADESGDPGAHRAPAAVPTAVQIQAPVDKLVVALSANRPCWVSAIVDGARTIEHLFQPGEQRTVEVRREMVLTAGDAAALSMTVNGANAKPLGKSGEVVTARMNLTNFREYLAVP